MSTEWGATTGRNVTSWERSHLTGRFDAGTTVQSELCLDDLVERDMCAPCHSSCGGYTKHG